MANTTISKVDGFPIPAKVRKAANAIAGKFAEYQKTLDTKTMVNYIRLISDTWDSFKEETKGSKVQFAVRLDPDCPTHRDTDDDGNPGYKDNAMYNAVVNATTRAKSSGKSPSKVGHTSEGGTIPELLKVQRNRFGPEEYTLDMVKNDLDACGTLSKQVVLSIMSFITLALDAEISPQELEEEEAEIEAGLKATG